MTNAEAFIQQYESNIESLQQGITADLPPAIIRYPNDSVYPDGQLVLHGMHSVEMDGTLVPFFDVSTGSGLELHAASDVAAVPTIFAENDTWEAHVGKERALVTLDPREAVDRRRLLIVAHEVGHTYDVPLVVDALRLTAGEEISRDAERELQPFTPAVKSLLEYAARTPGFIEDIRHLLGVGIKPAGEVTDLINGHSVDAYMLDDLPYHEATIAIGALREAAAWRRAFQLIEGGILHPGMSASEMNQEALRALESYEKMWGSRLHVATYASMK